MKKLHVYMLKSYLGPFVFTFFIALFILLLQFLWKYIDDLVGKGLEGYIIAKLMFYASSTFVPLALPLAILLSSLMTFGNLGEHYELVAMKSAGISLRKAMKPLVYLAIFTSIAAFLFSNYVLPVANLKFGSLLYDVRQQKLAFNLTAGVFEDDLNDFVIRIGEKGKDNKTIYDVQIYDHSSKLGNIKVTTAKEGFMELTPDQKRVIFTLYDGYTYSEITDQKKFKETRPFERMKFSKQELTFDLSEFQLNRTNEELFKSHYSMLNIKQLNESIDSLSRQRLTRLDFYKEKFIRGYNYLGKNDTIIDSLLLQKATPIIDTLDNDSLQYPLYKNFKKEALVEIVDMAQKSARNAKDDAYNYGNEYDSRRQVITKHQVVWHQKFKLSIACLLFFFIGAPLGAIIRKGGLGLPVVVSVIFFVLYHIVSMTGEKAAKTGEWDVVIGVWLSTILILPMGLFLTYKATTDAPLLDSESWKKTLEKFNIFKKKSPDAG
ncbi:MAG: LptF/LptG family permease [Bacteroidales bacterium]|jgi:lipopolysaccharide export system permease protein|nr:LptF/LptG family permease [Bacteroidales bacterium]